jgi:geranylgeranyl diphosphate synthase type II
LDGGKRLRSVITLTVAEALNPKIDLTKFALCVELLHNTSLVIDDMPCMDNDNYRRGKETIHFKYGSCKAQALVSYFLKKAYGFLHSNYTELKDKHPNDSKIDSIILSIYDILNKNMGFLGAATGQFIDICPMNSIIKEESYKKYYKSVENILDLIYLKTTTFFEIGFLPAYLLSLNREATSAELDKVHKLVKYFGLAFQISDDFDDIEQDKNRVNSEYNPNIVCKYGLEEARSIYDDALDQFLKLSSELNINHVVFNELCDFLNNRVNSVMIK